MRAEGARRALREAGPRPSRGQPEHTRERLVMAAAREIEERGYFGTDTNRIARAAGYSPATFYKHFEDKRAIFVAVYEDWVTREWARIGEIVARGEPPHAAAAQIADAVIAHHRSWPGFRASLRALVALDPVVRRIHRKWRRRQLATMGELGAGGETAPITMLIAERIGDAIADGEAEAIGLSEARARAYLVARIEEQLRGNKER